MARIIGKGFSFDDVLIIPKYNKVPSRKDVIFKTRVTRNYFIDMPLIAANMDTVCESKMAIAIGKLGGLGVLHRFMSIEEQVEEVRKVKEVGLLCSAAIGIKDYEERIPPLIRAGVDILVLDVAHGHSKRVGKVLDWFKINFPNNDPSKRKIDIMVGNVATKDAAEYFISKGADAIKVGIGPGSMCTTRIMTGAGVPQLTAIMDAYEATQKRIPVCADGGIRRPGDVVKALGAGADTVMLGSVFSGAEETPGEVIERNGKKFKKYRGMASYGAAMKKMQIDGKKHEEIINVEGEVTEVEFKGPIEPIVKKYLGGLASGMTYMGVDTIDKLSGKSDFIEISHSGWKESIAHGLGE